MKKFRVIYTLISIAKNREKYIICQGKYAGAHTAQWQTHF